MQLTQQNFERLQEPKVKAYDERITKLANKFFTEFEDKFFAHTLNCEECVELKNQLLEIQSEVLKEYGEDSPIYYDILGDAILNVLVPLDGYIEYLNKKSL